MHIRTSCTWAAEQHARRLSTWPLAALVKSVLPVQAGVAMGLAKAVAVRFPSWGPDFVFLMVRTQKLLSALRYKQILQTASLKAHHHLDHLFLVKKNVRNENH